MPKIYDIRRPIWPIGIPTASQFRRIITPTGKPSSMARAYMCHLVAQRLLGKRAIAQEAADEFSDDILADGNPHAERLSDAIQWAARGTREERKAATYFSRMKGVKLKKAGFVTTDDGRLGCALDRMVVGREEGLEIKCPSPGKQVLYLVSDPSRDHYPQLQGQLFIADLQAIHLFSYCDGLPEVHYLVKRDDDYLEVLVGLLTDFVQELEDMFDSARKIRGYVAPQQHDDTSTNVATLPKRTRK